MLFRRDALLPLALTLACSTAEDGSDEGSPATTGADSEAQTSGEPTTGADAGSTTTESDTAGSPTSDAPTSTSTPGDDTSTGSAPACGAGGVDDCCCFTVEGDAGHGILSVGCTAAESACEGLSATCPGSQVDCAAADLVITNPESLECALTALADGTVGPISWSVTSEDGLGGRSVTVFVQSDRSAFYSGYDYKELEYTYTAVDRRMLQDPGFFSDCAAAPGDGERFDCLRQAVGADATETCVDGFSGSAGRR
jgi:hypothetical protein